MNAATGEFMNTIDTVCYPAFSSKLEPGCLVFYEQDGKKLTGMTASWGDIQGYLVMFDKIRDDQPGPMLFYSNISKCIAIRGAITVKLSERIEDWDIKRPKVGSPYIMLIDGFPDAYLRVYSEEYQEKDIYYMNITNGKIIKDTRSAGEAAAYVLEWSIVTGEEKSRTLFAQKKTLTCIGG
jgi:hypothetical protein